MVILIALTMSAYTQSPGDQSKPKLTLSFNNDLYQTKIIEFGSEKFFQIEGFEFRSMKEFSIPARHESIVLEGIQQATLSLESVRRSSGFRAHPFFYFEYSPSKDSTINRTIKSLYGLRSQFKSNSIQIYNLKRTVEKNRTRYSFDVPLLQWDEANQSTYLVNDFTVALTSNTPIRVHSDASEQTAGVLNLFFRNLPLSVLNYIDTLGSWIDYSKQYIKFGVKTDTIYKIDRTWFQSHGVAVDQLEPSTVRLILKGKEIALVEKGMEDGKIDDGDYFLFFGKKNYAEGNYRSVTIDNEPYPQFIDKYDSTSSYWLTWGGAKGMRATNAQSVSATDSLVWFMDFLHSEDDLRLFHNSSDVSKAQLPDWTSEDTYIRGWINEGGSTSPEVTIKNLYPGISGRVFFKVAGWTSFGVQPAHKMIIGFNGSNLDSLSFESNKQALLQAELSPALLKEGKNSITLASRLVNNLAQKNQNVIDWYDVDYPRQLLADSNYIAFSARDQRMLGAKILRVRGFIDQKLQVLKITPQGVSILPKQMLQDGNSYACVFQDNVSLNDQYVIYREDIVNRAPTGNVVAFQNLRNASNNADYLLVTYSGFASAAKQYGDFITQQYGAKVFTIFCDDIYNEFGYGFFSPEAIKGFILYTQTNWSGTPPKYVLFLGDANYYMKSSNLTFEKPIYPENFVPSYGFPAGDGWYVCFDEATIRPTMNIGRLPVRSNEDILFYLDKHRKYLQAPYTEWNKTIIAFSGGDPRKGQSGLDELRNTNSQVIYSHVTPAPFGGKAFHFYKTINPQTDFGPVTPDEYRAAIDDGAICITYLGHSGTLTWDNSIVEAQQLNNIVDRKPLVSDFGCSTGKFAEPNTPCFAEMFVLDREKNSQAIAYLGNSALGFTSTAATLPVLFFETLLSESKTELGEAHRLAKLKLVDRYGTTMINRVAVQTNTLFADPILKLATPPKPNLVIKKSWPRIDEAVVTDQNDSMHFSIPVGNFGSVLSDSIDVLIEDISGMQTISSLQPRIPMPRYLDTLHIILPVKNISGARRCRITLDPSNQIQELSEADNQVELDYLILAATIQSLNTQYVQVGSKPDSITVLNPVFWKTPINSVVFDFDRSDLFNQAQRLTTNYGKVFSRLKNVPSMSGIDRVSWRVQSEGMSEYAGPFQYHNVNLQQEWLQQDTVDFGSDIRYNVQLTSTGVRLATKSTALLRAIGAGAFDGNTSIVEVNGINLLRNTFGYQWSVAVFDSITLQLKRQAQFLTWPTASERDSLKAYLLRIAYGEIVAMTGSDEPKRGATVFTDAIKALGSAYIDSLTSFGSFAMIGRKGAATGSVPEKWTASYKGKAVVEATYAVPPAPGNISTTKIGPAHKWKKLFVSYLTPSTSKIGVEVFGVDKQTLIDTLLLTQSTNIDSLDLSMIDASRFRTIKLRAILTPGAAGESPILKSWSVDYEYLPEIALNYQSVLSLQDTVDRGFNYPFEIGIVNPSITPSASFNVKIETIDQLNDREEFKTVSVPGLKPDEWFVQQLQIPTDQFTGNIQLVVTADGENLVEEQFENNNSYALPFFVRRDSTRPSIEVTFDNRFPSDGEYITPTPVIEVALYDAGPLPITQVENFKILENEEPIVKSTNPRVKLVPPKKGEKVRLQYDAQLFAGDYIFKFNARDASGNAADSNDIVVHVIVDTTTKILQLSNYPNPFSQSTAFNFVLTGAKLPESFKIKIYTVAGRLVKELEIPQTQLLIGYNVIKWDGRDADGDPLGNGVYFYKIVYTNNGKTETIIDKLAIVK